MGEHGVLLRMVSRVERREDFLDAFHPFVDERSVLVISKSVPTVGTQIAFSIELKDGLPVLRGEGVVDDPPLVIEPGRPVKVRLRIVKWTHDSEATFRQLLEHKRRATVRRAARASVPPPPPPPPKPEAVPAAVPADEEVTGAVAALAPPLPEVRTPGASYQLPANPFSEIPDHILEDFIECVLHPDVAQRPPGDGPEPPRGDPPASDSIPSFRGGAAAAAPVAVAAAPAPAPIPAVAAPAVVVAPPAVVVRSGLAPLLFTAVLAGGAAAAGMYIYLTRYHGEPVAAQAEPRPARAPTPLAPVAPAVAAHPAEPIARPPAPPVVVVPPPAAPPPAEPPPAEPPPAVATEPSPVADPDACLVSVRSHDEARVYVGERMVGNPPLQTEIMCDAPVIVAIVHPRYQRWERKVSGERGRPVILDVQLSRETLALAVNTAPSGATIAINGRIIGKSPTRTEVKAYSSVLVTASLDGYKLWSRRMQLTRPDTVTTRLDPIPGLP